MKKAINPWVSYVTRIFLTKKGRELEKTYMYGGGH
jgi:hypothetical protein